MLKNLIYAIALGAVSSCTMACGPVMPANQNQVGAERPLPPTDPNQVMLNLIQQRTLERALNSWTPGSQDKCNSEPVIKYIDKPRSMTCKQAEDFWMKRCGGEPEINSQLDDLGYTLEGAS